MHRRFRRDGQRSHREHRRPPPAHRDGKAARRDFVRGSGHDRKRCHDRRGLRDEDARRHRQERRSGPVHPVRSIEHPARGTGHRARWRSSVLFGIVVGSLVSCGKKGPPLAPLVKIPAAPADFTAERRGSDVKMQFAVPTTNTDGSKPANIERIDVYGFTGPSAVNDEQLLKLGTKVASLAVKAPRDPNATDECDEPDQSPGVPDLESRGLDQGAIAQQEDPLTQAAFRSVDLPRAARKPAAPPDAAGVTGPLAGSPSSVPRRMYVAVGVNKNGRRRSFSKRLLVPLVAAPDPPSTPQIAYDENAVTLTWTPSTSAVPVQPAATGDLLPGRFIGFDLPTFSYHVYDVSLRAAASLGKTGTAVADVRLTN